ncbi:hypothetical protein JDV02_005600 [Purpureocillium takamizusanense]|uniref:N-acetyltransferase domain-containing protein n=1 Tax=Purpureocillium takamizusanense TaxID=2060973 RepID=A0A9Q8VBX9_9HYPO|nr:uncharacterized protein JDV02_005600 [Purpureocillium takamizusanense]UNI19416.1 hypothetical protein JDV02_005600 [Purpureocillium takamizusanense]
MAITSEPWTSPSPCAVGRELVQVELPVLNALGAGDLAAAQKMDSLINLTPYLVSSECRGVWERRAHQIQADARDGVWITRLVIDARNRAVVGRAGFHGQPDQVGMVEIGYSIDSMHRRQGHARAAVQILLDAAAGDSRVKTVRASVRPDNIPSLSLIQEFGFQPIGEQWDDEDGLELVFERPCS